MSGPRLGTQSNNRWSGGNLATWHSSREIFDTTLWRQRIPIIHTWTGPSLSRVSRKISPTTSSTLSVRCVSHNPKSICTIDEDLCVSNEISHGKGQLSRSISACRELRIPVDDERAYAWWSILVAVKDHDPGDRHMIFSSPFPAWLGWSGRLGKAGTGCSQQQQQNDVTYLFAFTELAERGKEYSTTTTSTSTARTNPDPETRRCWGKFTTKTSLFGPVDLEQRIIQIILCFRIWLKLERGKRKKNKKTAVPFPSFDESRSRIRLIALKSIIVPSKALTLGLFFRTTCYHQNASHRKMKIIKVVEKLHGYEFGSAHFRYMIHSKKLRNLPKKVQSFHEV
jgi:hypothetical protein